MKCNVCGTELDGEQMGEHVKEHYLNNEKVKITRNRIVSKSVIDSKMLKYQDVLEDIEIPKVDFAKMTRHNVTMQRYILCTINGCGERCTSVKKLNQHKKEAHSY